MLRYLAPEERSIPSSVSYPGRCEDALAALNNAFSELVAVAPEFFRKDGRGTAINPPVTVSIAVTNGSKAAVITGASWASWMEGCTIAIDGSDIDNEITAASASGGDYNVTLRFPVDRSSGTVNGTVYHDSFYLQSDELEWVAPIEILGVAELSSITGPGDIKLPRDTEDYGRRTRTHLQTPTRRTQATGRPAVFWVDESLTSQAAAPRRRLRIFPIPRDAGTLAYEARIAPPAYSDPGATTTIPLSEAHASSILLPIAIYHFQTSPFFRQGPYAAAIEANYQRALALATRADPSPKSGPSFRPVR